MKYWDAVVCRHKIANFRSQHALTASSFPQSMIARMVLKLLKSRNTIAVLQRFTPFDAFLSSMTHFLSSIHDYF